MPDRISEIESYLQHRDYNLAIRRMLDLAFDAGNEELLRQTITWSRSFRQFRQGDYSEPSTAFMENAVIILQELRQTNSSFHFNKEDLLEVQNISNAYKGSRFVLQPISLAVSSGEVIGIVGEMVMVKPLC